MTEALKRRVLP